MDENDQIPRLTLSAFWFRAAVNSAAETDRDLVEIQMRTVGIGPDISALQVFREKQKHLVETAQRREDGVVVATVKKANLMELAGLMRDQYSLHIMTFGRDDPARVGYQNGNFTPCKTPYDAMKMAFEHS